MKNSAWTGRSARSMQAAFGPYTDDKLQPMRESRTESAAGFMLAVLIGVLLAAALVHWWAS